MEGKDGHQRGDLGSGQILNPGEVRASGVSASLGP